MKFLPTELPDVLVIEPDVHRDPRGFFLETYRADRYAAGGVEATFVQDNHSRSVQGTLRGLHAQRAFPQGKLVRCVEGAVFDVAVDIRGDSPSYGRWIGVELSGENFRQVWIPPGFAHGFAVLTPHAEIEYKCTDVYRPDDEIAIAWNDPAIGIAWPVAEPILSEKDRSARPLAEVVPRAPAGAGAA